MFKEKEKQFVEKIEKKIKQEQFSYIISHDLQEPLNTIISYCQLLHLNYEDITEEKKRKFIGHIYNSSTRMSWLIRDLLEFSKLSRFP